MKSRDLERPGEDAGAGWTRRVILGGLGTAGASIALAALASAAFGNAANPTAASSTETIHQDGTVTVTVSGTWSWGELAGVKTSPQQDCTGRSGVGWSVDWWGMSNSPSPTPGMGPTSGSLVNPTTSSSTPPSPTSGPLSVDGTWHVTSGAAAGQYFHTSALYNGFLADLCHSPAQPTPTGPIGPYSATATYPSLAAVPAKICVNFYDPHGKEGQYSTSQSDNYASKDGDNSIKTNDFDPLSVQGNCSTPVLTNLAINVDKNNDANQDGQFNKTETAKTAGQAVTFSVKITNPSTNNVPVVIDSLTDAAPGLTTHGITCKDGLGHDVIGQTLQSGDSVTCFFSESNYAPATGSLTDTVTVNVHQSGVPTNTATGTSTSTVNAPPAKATLAAKILLCSDPSFALPNNGSLVTSGGPTTVPSANNTLAATQVDPGTYTVAATAPTGYHLVVCGNYNGAGSQSTTLNNGDNKELDFFVAPNGSPNISYAKTGPATGLAGGTGDYTITLSNTGTATANGPLSFVDVLPVGETFNSVRPTSDAGMSCTPGPVTASGQVVSCTYANDLLKNTSASVVIRTNFAPGTEGQTLRDCTGNTQNTANVCWNTNIPQPNLTITKDGPGTGVPGGSGLYTITVKNTGQAPAAAVSFVDQLPAQESFVSAAGGDFNCTVNPNDATKINCVAKSGLLPLAVNGTLSVNVLVNYALTTVEGQQLTDCAILPNLNQDCATTVIHKPDLVIQKTGPATGTAGGNGTYTIQVRNTGQATANNVTFTDSLPVGESYVSFSSSTVSCSLSANPQVVNCSLNGPLAPGASVSVDVTVSYGTNTGGQTLTDCAILMTGNQSCVPTKIPSTPSISVVKTNDANGDGVFHDTEQANAQGDSVTFKVVVTNTSADPIVIDAVSDAFSATTLAECPQLINVVLNSGDSVTCTFTVDNYAPAAGDSLTNTITVNGHQNTPGGTPVTATDTSTVTTKVASPVDLAIVKTADRDTVKAGNTLTYTLSVSNVGPGATTGPITVTDAVPSGLDLVSVDGGSAWDCTTNGNAISCTYLNGVLNPGDTAPAITVVTTVNDTAVGSVINTGVVDTPGDVNPANNRSTVKTPVIKVLPEKFVKPTTPTTPTVLPFTGDRTGSMLPVGLAAVLTGLLLMVAGRRRRRTT